MATPMALTPAVLAPVPPRQGSRWTRFGVIRGTTQVCPGVARPSSAAQDDLPCHPLPGTPPRTTQDPRADVPLHLREKQQRHRARAATGARRWGTVSPPGNDCGKAGPSRSPETHLELLSVTPCETCPAPAAAGRVVRDNGNAAADGPRLGDPVLFPFFPCRRCSWRPLTADVLPPSPAVLGAASPPAALNHVSQSNFLAWARGRPVFAYLTTGDAAV